MTQTSGKKQEVLWKETYMDHKTCTLDLLFGGNEWYYKCSNCGIEFPQISAPEHLGGSYDIEVLFCPNCGAERVD
jgi:DNA-directed RNA polymerase subunit RPC12/RpoP